MDINSLFVVEYEDAAHTYKEISGNGDKFVKPSNVFSIGRILRKDTKILDLAVCWQDGLQNAVRGIVIPIQAIKSIKALKGI